MVWDSTRRRFKRWTRQRVLEFYASGVENYLRDVGDKRVDAVVVRGKTIKIGREDLRVMFTFVEFDECKFRKLKLNDEPMDKGEITWIITGEATTAWRGGNETMLSYGDLILMAKFLFNLIIFNFTQTTNTINVSYEKALLLYCMMALKRVDLLEIVYQGLKVRFEKFHRVGGKVKKGDELPQNQKSQPLTYPCLITALCELNNVPSHPIDSLKATTKVMTDAKFLALPSEPIKKHRRVAPKRSRTSETEEGSSRQDMTVTDVYEETMRYNHAMHTHLVAMIGAHMTQLMREADVHAGRVPGLYSSILSFSVYVEPEHEKDEED